MAIENLVEEAERQIREGTWIPDHAHRATAAKAATDLRAAVGTPQEQEALPLVDRLACLREALADVAIALAQVHGQLAWFLGAAATALTPVLHWRALSAEDRDTFGAVLPTLPQYTEAEEAVRRLQDALARIGGVRQHSA
ncbi:hypothetical protein [Streptomyces termitum]|uniref:hypothetical protein n=1 Tax=Streptomyces termitum TaxID=67368 RepID=UPI0033B001F2